MEMKITIVVPCYNSMKFLEQCMTSVLNQDYEDCIVWAYDNESTDGTHEYLLDLEKKHEKLTVFQVPNIYPNGYGEAQEHIMENIKTDYVTFVGSDDYITPNYISNYMKVIAHNPDKIKCVQSGLKGVKEGRLENSLSMTHYYKNLEEFKQRATFRSPVNTPTVVYHKSLVRFFRTHIAHEAAKVSCIGAGDYDTFCHLADIGIFVYPVPACLGYHYRWHPDQSTWKVHEEKQNGYDYDRIIQDYWKKKWNL